MSDRDPQECNCLHGTLLCTTTFGVKKNTKPFANLSLDKAGPFTLESHIHVKALKRQGLPSS